MANIGKPERVHEIVPDDEPVGIPVESPIETEVPDEEFIYVPSVPRTR